jgi:hypothetical protein
MTKFTFVCAMLAAGAGGCAMPLNKESSATPSTVSAVAADTGAVSPIVQVRDFPRSAVVSVVAWDSDDAEFGLRASVARTGELVGGERFGDHRLYLSPLYVRYMGGFSYAAILPSGQLLRRAEGQRDYYSCYYGNKCSPMSTLGVRMPDSLLRANRDSLVVTFFRPIGETWTLTLRRELIAAYLQRVDSVVGELRRVAGK